MCRPVEIAWPDLVFVSAACDGKNKLKFGSGKKGGCHGYHMDRKEDES